MPRMKKHTAATAAASVDHCRTFRQLRNYYQREYGITLHTDNEDRVNEMHYNTKDPVQKHVPAPGVYYYLIGTSGTPCKADTVFSPRIKDDPCLCVEKEWGQCKEYHNPELTKNVFHDLEQDARSDGTTLHTSVVVTYPELCKRVGDMDFSFGHMYVLMAALTRCLGDFGARFLVPPA